MPAGSLRRRERAAHKPLLILYARGHFQRNGNTPIAFSQAGDELRRLLRDFGPPRSTTPAYPFHHLTSDGFWTVSTDEGGGSPPALRRAAQAVSGSRAVWCARSGGAGAAS